jgi:hypothetical protein
MVAMTGVYPTATHIGRRRNTVREKQQQQQPKKKRKKRCERATHKSWKRKSSVERKIALTRSTARSSL